MSEINHILQKQIEYYRLRATEYDEWFLRMGRYNHGKEENTRWFCDVEECVKILDEFYPQGDVLELACGTGWWTEKLAKYASAITAVDASPEVININRGRLKNYSNIHYKELDLFSDWQLDQQYDVIFFSFWLSHVPPNKFEEFWQKIRAVLKSGGRVFFIDSIAVSTATANNQQAVNNETFLNTRKLNDGREFEIVKIWYKPEELENKIKALGWNIEVKSTSKYFLYGMGSSI